MNTITYQNQVHLHVLNVKKFKDITVSVRFLNDLKKETVTLKSLLSIMLQDRCQKYDTKQKMSTQLDLLYGAGCSTKIMGFGQSQVLELKSRVLNDLYVNEGLFEKQLDLIYEIIFSPLLIEETLQEAKRVLKDYLARVSDNPAQYAVKKALEISGEGYPLSVSVHGSFSQIETVTLQDIKDEYERMMQKDQIDIFVIGQMSDVSVVDLVKRKLPFVDRSHDLKTEYTLDTKKYQEIEQYKKTQQTTMVLVYNSSISISHPLYWPLRVANALLGQLPTSKLFQEVREKNSLCYSIYSSVIAFEGVLYISVGIDDKNIEITKQLIKKQVQDMQAGIYTQNEIDVSKRMIINSLYSSLDDKNSMVSLAYQNKLLDKHDTVDVLIEKIQNTTKEQMIEAMNLIHLNTVFLLRKDENHE